MLRGGSTEFDFQIVKSDDYPTFTMTLYEGDNETPIDLRLASTSVILIIKKPDGMFLEIPVSKLGDGKEGGVFHQWSSDEIDVIGRYEVEGRIFFDGGRKYTCLNRTIFEVVSSLRGN